MQLDLAPTGIRTPASLRLWLWCALAVFSLSATLLAQSILSGVFIGAWDGAVQNFAPNVGYDWGGRVTAAWLNR